MLNCDEAARHLVYAVDDPAVLDASVRETLEDHLNACPSCRQVLDEHRAVAAWLNLRPPNLPSAGFTVALAARLDVTAGWLAIADWQRWTFRLLPATAILILAAFVWPSSPGPRSAIQSNPSAGATAVSESSSPDAILWQFGASADAVVDAMLTGGPPPSPTFK